MSVTARPMIMRWISDVPSKMVKLGVVELVGSHGLAKAVQLLSACTHRDPRWVSFLLDHSPAVTGG